MSVPRDVIVVWRSQKAPSPTGAWLGPGNPTNYDTMMTSVVLQFCILNCSSVFLTVEQTASEATSWVLDKFMEDRSTNIY